MASLIPGYEYDIFISYRQKDNKYDGWVTEFVDNLKKELEATFKEDISLYFDINTHDGLLETHDVDASLKKKLKCLVFIPILSRTYCDPKSFAWEHEFKAFVKQASQDQFSLKVNLISGNVATRVLPVRIHDLDKEDINLCKSILGGFLRGIDFIYKSPGINRPLQSKEENPHDNLNHTIYRDQINKVALAIKDIIESMRISFSSVQGKTKEIKVRKTIEENEFLIDKTVLKKEIKSKQVEPIEKAKLVKSRRFSGILQLIIIFSVIFILGLISIKLYYRQKNRNYARFELIPQIQKLIEEESASTFRAFELATKAEKYIPDDSILIGLWSDISEKCSLQTHPEGAKVSWTDYNKPKGKWKILGITPLQNIRVPYGYKRIKIEKDGFNTVLLTSLYILGPGPERSIKLDSVGVLPDNMVRIPSRIAWTSLYTLDSYKGKLVEEFLIDRYEVTNKEYKRFVDSGGYNNKSYWSFPIYSKGKEMSWESAMSLFVDKTGKQGPADWEVGYYPDGQEDYPVAGISWYEASAYAAFTGKKLPTVYHWSSVAETYNSSNIIPFSNFNKKSTVPVGSMEGISSFGIYDLAGNVREWCYNETEVKGESYILGGGWNDPAYAFMDAGSQSSLNRSLSNGFRCIKELKGDSIFVSLSYPIKREYRDYNKEKPVNDRTFNIILRQYSYDKLPLNTKLMEIENPGIWKINKVTIDAGYNDERLDVYLFLPKDGHPPYQPVIYWEGSGAIFTNVFRISDMEGFAFLARSGRALVFPILKSTYNRKDALDSDYPAETVFYKDHVIMWRKDIGRTIDYLETRSDILSDKIGYFGWSWGGIMGGIIPAVEKRIKAIVLTGVGMVTMKTLPEVDHINFLPRVYQPVLIMNGKYDMFFPVEISQIPFFNLLGTPSKEKSIKIYDSGHLVPKSELIKETLVWFDKYLGPVK